MDNDFNSTYIEDLLNITNIRSETDTGQPYLDPEIRDIQDRMHLPT